LPGTQKYWKMWYDNFFKALLMFPLIISLIAVGRIFAWIVGSSGGATGLLDMLAVLVGYFGPYFFLPKTFKWGGQALSMAGNGLNSVSKKIGEKPKALLQERQKELSNQKQISAAMRLNQWAKGSLSTRQKIGSAIRGDKLRSGEWDPTYVGMPPGVGRKEMMRQRREKMAKFRAAVPRAEEEEIKDEVDKLRLRTSDMSEGARGDLVKGIIAAPQGTHSQAEVQAALKQALSDRDYATVEAWVNGNVGTAQGREQINMFRNLNAGDLAATVPHMLKGDLDEHGLNQGVVRAAGSSQQEVAAFHPRAVEAILSHLSHEAQHNADAGSRTTAHNALTTFLRTYAAATQNSSVQGSINQGAADKVREFLDANNATIGDYSERTRTNAAYNTATGGDAPIQRGPDDAERTAIFSDPAMATTVQTIETKIQPGGVVTPGAASVNRTLPPTEIRIEHQNNYQVSIPGVATLAAAGPQREAFKAQIISDPGTVETLAHSLAYDVDPNPNFKPTQTAVLQELRTSIVAPAGGPPTPDRVASYNRIIDTVQRAYTQRINDAAEHARATTPLGGPITPEAAAAAAAQAERAILAPEMQNFESMRIT